MNLIALPQIKYYKHCYSAKRLLILYRKIDLRGNIKVEKITGKGGEAAGGRRNTMGREGVMSSIICGCGFAAITVQESQCISHSLHTPLNSTQFKSAYDELWSNNKVKQSSQQKDEISTYIYLIMYVTIIYYFNYLRVNYGEILLFMVNKFLNN